MTYSIRIPVIIFLLYSYSFFTGSIFCSTVVLVLTINTSGGFSFMTNKENIPVNVVPFFNGVSFPFCHFLKPGVTDELKSLFILNINKVRVCYSKQDKTLLLLKR